MKWRMKNGTKTAFADFVPFFSCFFDESNATKKSILSVRSEGPHETRIKDGEFDGIALEGLLGWDVVQSLTKY